MERFGTRHKAALGITEQTDAIVVVVSEETGQISLVERARIVRNLDEPKLTRALATHLHPALTGTLLTRQSPSGSLGPTFRDLARRARIGRIHRESHTSPQSGEGQGNPRADDEPAA